MSAPWWRRVPLSEVVLLQRGHDLPTSERGAGHVPIIGSFGVTGTHDTALYEGPGVAIGRSGAAIGTATYVASSYWPLNTCLFVRDFKGNDPRWIYYLLDSIDFMAFNSGSAQPSLNRNFLRDFPVALPSLIEQQAIAEVLGVLDDKIAANEKAGSISRELARSIFSRAAIEGSKATIRNVAKLVTRGITPKYVESDGVVVLNQKCVRDQRINLTPSRITQESSVRAEKILRCDDVLVNSTGAGTLGRIARWTRDIRATVDSHITIVRFDSGLVDPVCAGFGLLQIEKEVEGLAEGSTGQTELRRDLLAGLEIYIPGEARQGSVGAELSALDALSLGLQQESDRLAATRHELLPLLMSGTIRVREAEKVVEGVV